MSGLFNYSLHYAVGELVHNDFINTTIQETFDQISAVSEIGYESGRKWREEETELGKFIIAHYDSR